MPSEKKSIGESFSRFCAAVIIILLLCFTAYLLISALTGTVTVSTGGGEGEIVVFNDDDLFVNAIITVVFAAAVYLICLALDNVPARAVEALLAAWVIVFGAAFVCSAKLQPTQDSYIVTFFARQAAKGDFSYYHDYFRSFPFQLGFAMYEELLFRAIDLIAPNIPEGFSSVAVQLLNVLYVAVSYVALFEITGLLFYRSHIRKTAAVLLFFCWQPILFCTFMYGNIPAFAFICLGVWMFVLFRKKEKMLYGILCAVFIALAVLLKLNSLIAAAALGIVMTVCLIKKPGMKTAVCLVLLAALTLLVKPLPQKYYEKKMGEPLGNGIPQLAWMAMGLNEGQSCAGWYDTEYTMDAFCLSGYDTEATKALAKTAVKEAADRFAEDPIQALSFFDRKFRSQWNDPTGESLWTNRLRPSYSQYGKLYTFLCETEYCESFMNYVQQLVLFCFLTGLLRSLKRKDILRTLLPLIVLGAMLYHLMFEAKSQYALTYYILMIPTAAYGLVTLIELTGGKKKKKERN